MCRATSIAENRKIGIVATSDAGTSIHMWNNATEGYFLNGGKRGWTEGDTDYTVGELGGVSDNVISVGSYNTKMDYTTLGGDVYGINTALVGNKGALSLFSSHGPTLDGRTKPDVTAPGCLLISATSKYYAGVDLFGEVGRRLLRRQYGYVDGFACRYRHRSSLASG